MLARQVSTAIADSFRIPPPPTLSARVAGDSQVALSHFSSDRAQPGLSRPSAREEAFVLNIPLAPARYAVVSVDGLRQTVVQSPGEAYLFDLTRRNEVSLDTCYDSVRFHIPQSTINNIMYERESRRVSGLRADNLGVDDAILYNMAKAVRPVILSPSQATTSFIEYIGLALCEHVIHTYGNASGGWPVLGGLAPWQVRRACEYIEANLAADPSIAVMSRECGLSSSHFARAFRASTGLTPHAWITKRRLAHAKAMMLDSREPLAAIAILCGFVDQSHFGRRFLKEEGRSPAQWRRLHMSARAVAASMHDRSPDQ